MFVPISDRITDSPDFVAVLTDTSDFRVIDGAILLVIVDVFDSGMAVEDRVGTLC